MLRLTLRSAAYALTALTTVGFGIWENLRQGEAQQPAPTRRPRRSRRRPRPPVPAPEPWLRGGIGRAVPALPSFGVGCPSNRHRSIRCSCAAARSVRVDARHFARMSGKP